MYFQSLSVYIVHYILQALRYLVDMEVYTLHAHIWGRTVHANSFLQQPRLGKILDVNKVLRQNFEFILENVLAVDVF